QSGSGESRWIEPPGDAPRRKQSFSRLQSTARPVLGDSYERRFARHLRSAVVAKLPVVQGDRKAPGLQRGDTPGTGEDAPAPTSWKVNPQPMRFKDHATIPTAASTAIATVNVTQRLTARR